MAKIIIKNMVCDRCIQAVKTLFKDLDIRTEEIGLGWVQMEESLSLSDQERLNESLKDLGFKLLDDRQSVQIENLKKALRKWVYEPASSRSPLNLSEYLSREMNKDYYQLSRLFSSTEGITIEKYFQKLKIERAKELLIYNQLNLAEIAHELDYSNASYLAALFKRETGMTTKTFKQQFPNLRKPLDEV
jgi:AraC-like DNA-binding protein